MNMAKPASFCGSKLVWGVFGVVLPSGMNVKRRSLPAAAGILGEDPGCTPGVHRHRKCGALADRCRDDHIRAGRSPNSAWHLRVNLLRRNVQQRRGDSIERHGGPAELGGERKRVRGSGLNREIGPVDRDQHLRNDRRAAAGRIRNSSNDGGLRERAGNHREGENHIAHQTGDWLHGCYRD